MIPTRLLEMVPRAVVEMVPVLVVEIVPVLVVEMVPLFATEVREIAKINIAAPKMNFRFFISRSWLCNVRGNLVGLRVPVSHPWADH